VLAVKIRSGQLIAAKNLLKRRSRLTTRERARARRPELQDRRKRKASEASEASKARKLEKEKSLRPK
jgi:hypothetical protein